MISDIKIGIRCFSALTVAVLIPFGIIYGQVNPNIFQTPEEQSAYLLELINDYRAEKGRNKLILDTAIVNACRHHSIYMSFYDIAGHYETRRDSVHLQQNIWDPWDRARHYKVVLGSHSAENSLNLGSFHYDDKVCGESSVKWAESVKSNNPNYKYAAAFVLDAWKSSWGHNRVLLLSDGASCGVYVRAYENKRGLVRIASTFFINSYYPGIH